MDLWPDSRVSRRHAKVWYEKNCWWIKDVDSKHGTLLGGKEIKGKGAIRLEPDVEIYVGDTVLVLDPPNRHRSRWKDLVREVDTVSNVNYSLLHCRLPVVSRVAVHNKGKRRSYSLKMTILLGRYGSSDTIFIPALEPRDKHIISNPSIQFDLQAFERQIERQLTHLSINIGNSSAMEIDLCVLAHNEWSMEESYRLTLASFVLPNHPLIKSVEIEARGKLKKITEREFDSFHVLLQSNREDMVELAMEAFYECLRNDWHLHYQYEPSSFEFNSQKVRLPHQVLSNTTGHRGQGTCIDLSLLLAACLESTELHPLLVFVEIAPQCYHAMIACWREEAMENDPIITNRDKILNECVLVECTGCAEKKYAEDETLKTLDFDAACEEAVQCIKESAFLYALDICAARDTKITPLPFEGDPQNDAVVSKVIRQAHDFARDLGIPVGTVPLLLALIKEEGGLTQQVLKELHIDLHFAQQKLETGLSEQGRKNVVIPIPTPHYDQVLTSASALAKRQSSPVVLESHLLVALLEIQSQATDNALKALGTNRTDFKKAVISFDFKFKGKKGVKMAQKRLLQQELFSEGKASGRIEKNMVPEAATFQEQLLAVRQQLWPKQEKIAILVDGAYLHIQARKKYGRDVNYAALMREALQKSQLEKAVVFTFESPNGKRFYNALRNFGYEVKTKPIKVFKDGKTKCNCDGEIITEMFDIAQNGVQKIVLVAGDSDFESPLQYLKEKGEKIQIIGIKGSVAKELKRLAPIRYIDEGMLMQERSK